MDLVNLNKQLFVKHIPKKYIFIQHQRLEPQAFSFSVASAAPGALVTLSNLFVFLSSQNAKLREATDVGFLVIWQKLNFTGVSHEASNLFASAVIIVACRHNQIFTASKRVSKCTQHFSMFITDARATPPTCACRPAR